MPSGSNFRVASHRCIYWTSQAPINPQDRLPTSPTTEPPRVFNGKVRFGSMADHEVFEDVPLTCVCPSDWKNRHPARVPRNNWSATVIFIRPGAKRRPRHCLRQRPLLYILQGDLSCILVQCRPRPRCLHTHQGNSWCPISTDNKDSSSSLTSSKTPSGHPLCATGTIPA